VTWPSIVPVGCANANDADRVSRERPRSIREMTWERGNMRRTPVPMDKPWTYVGCAAKRGARRRTSGTLREGSSEPGPRSGGRRTLPRRNRTHRRTLDRCGADPGAAVLVPRVEAGSCHERVPRERRECRRSGVMTGRRPEHARAAVRAVHAARGVRIRVAAPAGLTRSAGRSTPSHAYRGPTSGPWTA
jgi:hypothetical protein